MEATHLNDERFVLEYQPVDPAKVMREAGSEIDKLRAENARLRLALDRIANTQPMISEAMSDWRETAIYCSRTARAALAGSR